jgi:hypothetical protein
MQGIEQFLDCPTRNLVSIPLKPSKPPISAITTTNAISFFRDFPFLGSLNAIGLPFI